MSEGPPQAAERMDAMKIDGVALDRGVINAALDLKDQTVRLERVNEQVTRQHFLMQVLIDRRSGRVMDASMDTGRAFAPAGTEAIAAVNGILTSRLDDQGRVAEEDLVLSDVTLSDEQVSDKVRAHLKKVMETWRESRTRYIVNP